MEKWQQVQKPPSRRGCDYPSFSSTLLDSIYRSIDDETDHRGAPDPAPKKKPTAAHDKWAPPVIRPKPEHHHHQHSKKNPAAVTGLHHHHHFPSTTSSSSDCSSYGGFSSSEPESNPTRLKPIRTGNFQTRSDQLPPPVPLLAAAEKKKKNNLSSIRSRFRDLKKARSPTSPAARLASFLNSIFTSSSTGNSRKLKANAVNSGEESACSTASSYSRSCLVKTPSTSEHAVKRSVRFQLPVDGGNGRREEGRYGWRENKKQTMTWRGYEEVDDDDDVASDSSSDLFELENLTAVGRYRDELPVYETTHLGGLLL